MNSLLREAKQNLTKSAVTHENMSYAIFLGVCSHSCFGAIFPLSQWEKTPRKAVKGEL